MNGKKVSTHSPVPITFQTATLLPGAYEFRQLTASPYSLLKTSGVMTLRPPLITVNGVAAPQTLSVESGSSIQVDVSSSKASYPATNWVGIYRLGAPATDWLDWVYLNGLRTVPSGSNPHAAIFTMTVPNTRGPFELRLFYSSSYVLEATGPTMPSEVRTRAAGGDAHTLVARADGSVWASGLNASGQLGVDSTVDQTTPIQVPDLENVVSVAAGASHSMALTLKFNQRHSLEGAKRLPACIQGSLIQARQPRPSPPMFQYY